MDFHRLTAPCGIDCFNCPVLQADENPEIKARVASALGVAEEEVHCRGCRDENGTIGFLGMKGPCKVYRCIQEKGFDFCFECPDFACDNLHPYADKAAARPHNTKVFNLLLIKRLGLEEWARNKAGQVRKTYYTGKLEL